MSCKADYVFILNRRRINYTLPHMWKSTDDELRQLMGTLTDMEKVELTIRYKQRDDKEKELFAQFCVDSPRNRGKITKTWLEKYIRSCGQTVSAGITYEGLIDQTIEPLVDIPMPKIELDEDQKAAIEKWNDQELCIIAGPGAGKTTTVCHLAKRINHERPASRILILVFNRDAQQILTTRLYHLRASIISKADTNNEAIKGICVLTFDKFAYQCGVHIDTEGNDGLDDLYGDTSSQVQAPAADYRINMEKTLVSIEKYNIKWDYLIVDEAQDVNITHAQFIQHFETRNTHIISAGDPRQELYAGATWFSHKIASSENKCILRYNHRSSIEIVNLLNDFSRHNFPLLHHDQIATSQEQGVIEHIDEDGPNIGIILAQLAAKGSIYAIAPVTIKKWKLEDVTNSARQSFHAESGGVNTITIADDYFKNGLTPSMVTIATSKKIKGSERDATIVFGINRNYAKIIPKTDLIKSIFVAISRAKSHLILAFHQTKSGKTQMEQAMAEIWGDILSRRGLNVTIKYTIKPKPYYFINVTGDECRSIESLNYVTNHEVIEMPGLAIDIKNDYDFIGIYVELLLAYKLLNMCESYISITEHHKASVECNDDCVRYCRCKTNITFYNDNRFIVICNSNLYKQIRGLIAERSDTPLSRAIIKFSIRIGQLWTVSDHLLKQVIDIEPIITALKAKFKTFAYSPKRNVLPSPYRCDGMVDAGELTIIPDFVVDGKPLEIKYTSDIGNSHINQIMVYNSVYGSDGYIYNIKSGEMRHYLKPESFHENLTRALIFSMAGKEKSIALKPRAVKFMNITNVCIAVDIETSQSKIIELGAIAFTVSGQVIGTYYDISSNTINVTESDDLVERLIGLRVVDDTRVNADHLTMRDKFLKWTSSVSPNCTLLHWTGKEKETFGLPAIDVWEAYKIWSGQTSQTKLGDAMNQIYSKELVSEKDYALHRAYDDALCTMAVFMAVSNFEGLL